MYRLIECLLKVVSVVRVCRRDETVLEEFSSWVDGGQPNALSKNGGKTIFTLGRNGEVRAVPLSNGNFTSPKEDYACVFDGGRFRKGDKFQMPKSKALTSYKKLGSVEFRITIYLFKAMTFSWRTKQTNIGETVDRICACRGTDNGNKSVTFERTFGRRNDILGPKRNVRSKYEIRDKPRCRRTARRNKYGRGARK